MPARTCATYRRGVSTPRRKTFFVESYIPRLDEATAAALSSRLRTAIDELRREGRTLEWLRSFALVSEETYVWMVTADDVDEVALMHQRAQVPYDHVVEAVTGDEPQAVPPRHSGPKRHNVREGHRFKHRRPP
jgi:hypothetical protein